jgi:hypothetical protein
MVPAALTHGVPASPAPPRPLPRRRGAERGDEVSGQSACTGAAGGGDLPVASGLGLLVRRPRTPLSARASRPAGRSVLRVGFAVPRRSRAGHVPAYEGAAGPRRARRPSPAAGCASAPLTRAPPRGGRARPFLPDSFCRGERATAPGLLGTRRAGTGGEWSSAPDKAAGSMQPRLRLVQDWRHQLPQGLPGSRSPRVHTLALFRLGMLWRK